MEPDLEIICVSDCFEILIDIGMELIVFRMQKDIFLLDGYQRHCQIEQIVLILLVDVVVKDFVDQGDFDVPTIG